MIGSNSRVFVRWPGLFFKELMEFQWGTMNPVEEAYSEAHGILAENV